MRFVVSLGRSVKFRVFVTPQTHALDSEVAVIGQALERVGFRGITGIVVEQKFQLEIDGDDTPAGWSAIGQVAREFETSFSEWARSGVTVRCEVATDVPLPAGEAMKPQAAVEPEPVQWHDLDGARAHEALPKILSRLPAWQPNAQPLPVGALANATGLSDGAAAVVRLALSGGEKLVGVVTAHRARFCDCSAYDGARIAAAESLRALACVGAKPLAVSYRLILAEDSSPKILLRVRECLRGLAEVCAFFNVEVMGAEVKSTIDLPDATAGFTLALAAVGAVSDDKHVTGSGLGAAGQSLVLLGETPFEIGGSLLGEVIHGFKGGFAPECDLAAEKRLDKTLLALIKGGVIAAVRDLREGGLLVAVSDMLLASAQPLGARLDLTPLGGARADGLLFGESQGRAIVAVPAARVGTLLAEAHMRGVPAALIGEVTEAPTLALKTRSLATEWFLEELKNSRARAADDAA